MKSPVTPLFLTWEVTSRCNLACKTCYADSYSDLADDLEGGDVDNLIKQIIACRPLFVDISGGEPLLRSDIFDIIRKLKSGGVDAQLSTNGQIVAVDGLKSGGAKSIQISIDGFRESHEKIRGYNTYHKALDALSEYLSAGFAAGVATVITSYNIREIPRLALYIHGLGAKRYTVFRFVPMGRGAKHPELMVTEEELMWLRKKLNKLEEDLGREFIRYDHSLNLSSGKGGGREIGGRCLGLGIKPNGDIVLCHFSQMVLGNTRETTILEVWSKSQGLKRLKEVLPGDLAPSTDRSSCFLNTL